MLCARVCCGGGANVVLKHQCLQSDFPPMSTCDMCNASPNAPCVTLGLGDLTQHGLANLLHSRVRIETAAVGPKASSRTRTWIFDRNFLCPSGGRERLKESLSESLALNYRVPRLYKLLGRPVRFEDSFTFQGSDEGVEQMTLFNKSEKTLSASVMHSNIGSSDVKSPAPFWILLAWYLEAFVRWSTLLCSQAALLRNIAKPDASHRPKCVNPLGQRTILLLTLPDNNMVLLSAPFKPDSNTG